MPLRWRQGFAILNLELTDHVADSAKHTARRHVNFERAGAERSGDMPEHYETAPTALFLIFLHPGKTLFLVGSKPRVLTLVKKRKTDIADYQ